MTANRITSGELMKYLKGLRIRLSYPRPTVKAKLH